MLVLLVMLKVLVVVVGRVHGPRRCWRIGEGWGLVDEPAVAQATPSALPMLAKHNIGTDRWSIPPAKRLRMGLENRFASNQLSAIATQQLLVDGAVAGSSRECALVTRKVSSDKNIARDLTRRLLQNTRWPKPYICGARVWDTKAAEGKMEPKMSVLLPHEVVAKLLESGDSSVLLQREGMDKSTLQHLLHCEDQLKTKLLGVGLWGDGVPCNWDRSDSLELLSLNFPGLPTTSEFKALRIPLTGLAKKHVAGKDTYDDLMKIIVWSLEALASGRWPRARHDGSPWQAGGDAVRAKMAGKPLGLRGCLVEVRGDWAFYKLVFSFPQWNEKAGMCWRCTCTPAQLCLVGLEAPWRQPDQRLSHGQLLLRMHEQSIVPSTLMEAPFVKTDIFRCDWLHAVDQGVTADFLGNLLLLLAKKLPGGSLVVRVAALWARLQDWYTQHQVADRLMDLKPSMLRKKGKNKAPKLRAGAAVARAMVPFALVQARLLLGDQGVEGAAKAAAVQLCRAYDCLRAGTPPGQLEEAARLFALQSTTLQTYGGGGGLWRVMPKMHLFLEMAMEGGEPAKNWVYRDEDFGGTAARLIRRRGGPGPRARLPPPATCSTASSWPLPCLASFDPRAHRSMAPALLLHRRPESFRSSTGRSASL